MVKCLAYNAGDLGSIPGSGRSSGEGNGTPLQYSCLENPMDRGAWWDCSDHRFWCQIGLQYMFAGGIASFNVNNLAPKLVCIPSKGVESFLILESLSVLNYIFSHIDT